MISLIETPEFFYRIVYGIFHLRYPFTPFLDLDKAKRIVARRLVIQGDEPYPILCDTRGIVDSSKAARDYLAREGSYLAEVVALFDDRLIGNSMTDIYRSHTRPTVRTHFFSDEGEAFEFLRSWKTNQR